MLGKRAAALLGSAAAVGLAMPQAAHAGAFALREQSAYGQGSSFAGIAAGGSLSSMFWNPATLMDIDAIEIESVVTGVIPISEVDVTSPFDSDEGDIGQDAIVPAAYAAYRLNDRLVLGMGLNGAFGLVTEYDDDSPLRGAGIAGNSEVFSLNLNPSVSYEVTDWLAVAVGAQIQYIDIGLTEQFIPGLGISTIEGDDVGLGFTAGLKLTPMNGTEIGLGYRSFIDHELDGELDTAAAKFDVTGEDFNLPDMVTVGLRQSLTDNIRVMAGAEWSNWSRFDTVNIDVTDLDATIPLGFEYDDGWFFSAGGEVDVTDQITLRAGIGYELSPIDEDNRTYRLPDNDRLWLSAGGSFKASERWSFDAGYTFISAEQADIQASAALGGSGPPANGPFGGEADSRVHILSAGVKFKLGGARQPMKQAVVLK